MATITAAGWRKVRPAFQQPRDEAHGGVQVDDLNHMTVEFSASTNAPAAIVAVITKHIDEQDYSDKLPQ